MEDNAIEWAGAEVGSGAMLIVNGYGNNMVANTRSNGSLLNASAIATAGSHLPPGDMGKKPVTGIMRGVAFSAHTIWRACQSSLNVSCINEDVLPLLRGAISTYHGYAFTSEEDGLVHLRDVGWESSTAPAGVQRDNSVSTGTYMYECRCRSELAAASSGTWRSLPGAARRSWTSRARWTRTMTRTTPRGLASASAWPRISPRCRETRPVPSWSQDLPTAL